MNLRTGLALSLGIGAVTLLCAAAPAPNPAGEALFKARCQMCHSVAPGGAPGPMAPNLRGVVGRKAGSSASFKSYSPALTGYGQAWNKANLDKFLEQPSKLVPGTRMVIALPDAKQRADVIDYLSSQK